MATQQTTCSISEYNERLNTLLDGRMDYRKYKALKAVIVSTIIAGMYAFAITNGAPMANTTYIAFFALLVANGLELGEIISVDANGDGE